MIGLGSNRLTVCRRGGMSVTQAGRGGMEWLAGGRVPSWASPYSAQATAALKAQFPTKWPTIRDYGFAHPALVPFINEDPMLVMSLIEGLGVRKLVGDGVAYLHIPISITTLDRYKIEIENRETVSSYQPFFDTETYAMACWFNQTNGVTTLTSSESDFSCPQGNHIFEKIEGKWYVDGVQKQSKTLTEITYSGFWLFSWSGAKSRVNKGAMRYAIIGNEGSEKFIGVPCKHNGENGMLDAVHAVWYGNEASSGSFTISETPAS